MKPKLFAITSLVSLGILVFLVALVYWRANESHSQQSSNALDNQPQETHPDSPVVFEATIPEIVRPEQARNRQTTQATVSFDYEHPPWGLSKGTVIRRVGADYLQILHLAATWDRTRYGRDWRFTCWFDENLTLESTVYVKQVRDGSGIQFFERYKDSLIAHLGEPDSSISRVEGNERGTHWSTPESSASIGGYQFESSYSVAIWLERPK